MVATPYRRLPGLWDDLFIGGKVIAALWVPVVRVAGDLAKMAGYPVGRVWRARNHPPRWREEQTGRLHAVSAHLTDADERQSARLNIAEEPGKRRALASLVTHSGDVLPYLILLALLFVLGGAAWRFRTLALLAADTLTFLVAQLLKVIIRRIRPEGKWGEMYRRIDPYSFPSGHAARGGAMAAMGLIVGPLWFGAALAVWGLSLAVSRVVLGVHFLSDAVAGFALGVIIAVVLGLLVL